jgi:hypothetical protein
MQDVIKSYVVSELQGKIWYWIPESFLEASHSSLRVSPFDFLPLSFSQQLRLDAWS